MLEQAKDLRAEGEELDALLATLSDADWDRRTQFKGWTVNDVIQHIHFSDYMAILSATDPDAYLSTQADVRAKREAGMTRVAETRERLQGLAGRALHERWRETLWRLCEVLGARDPNERLRWGEREMGVRMFTSARQMECWAHGQEIYDLLGRTRSHSDRIRNIAVLGVRTFGWTFANRKLPVPTPEPYVRLTAPSGAYWEWNAPSESDAVIGDAVAFCQVVTQVRNVADTALDVRGTAARQWMALAQCFAGPPETPPLPGTRGPDAGGGR